MTPEEIQKALTATATQLGVSDAKLKAIYARGIKDCIKNGYPEAPYVHGLTRVQQFVRSYNDPEYYGLDSDFLPQTAPHWVPPTLPDIEALIFDQDKGSFTACGDSWVCELVPENGSWTICTVE